MKLRWGVLGVAGIAVRKVIPAMQHCKLSEIVAIASRDGAKAAEAAAKLGVARAYGSYEALLADPDIDCIYNPLPNHLHVPWSIRALEAGKHVLCEKPLALNRAEIDQLIAVRDRTGRQAAEAFMVRVHPQWLRAKQLLDEGALGRLRSVHGVFSYFNRDPANVRNRKEWGGGGVLDIGCYPVFLSRWMYGEEPRRVCALIEDDPEFGVDRLASVVMEFPGGQASFVCATQMAAGQRMQLHGEKARLEVEIPFNAPNDRPTRLWVDTGDLSGAGRREETFAVCDQYTLQADAFCRAVRGDGEVPVTLEDARRQMAVLEAILQAGASGQWESVGA
jgi:predicted dehydrogenase